MVSLTVRCIRRGAANLFVPVIRVLKVRTVFGERNGEAVAD